MDYLRSEVHLHAIAQKDPLIEFKHEAFSLFHRLSNDLQTDIDADIFKFKIAPQYEGLFEQQAAKMNLETSRSLFDEISDNGQQQRKPEKAAPIHHEDPKVHRNDTCPCGSGKKYKRCCGITKGQE